MPRREVKSAKIPHHKTWERQAAIYPWWLWGACRLDLKSNLLLFCFWHHQPKIDVDRNWLTFCFRCVKRVEFCSQSPAKLGEQEKRLVQAKTHKGRDKTETLGSCSLSTGCITFYSSFLFFLPPKHIPEGKGKTLNAKFLSVASFVLTLVQWTLNNYLTIVHMPLALFHLQVA